MDTATPRLSDRAIMAVRALSERPAYLFLTLLALNAIAFPYAGFVHDARLYGVQVLNQLQDGAFADDLFFRFGSQDQYSLFSPVAAPIVGILGLPIGFFLLYLGCNAAFIFATQRLMRALIADGVISTMALLAVMVTPLTFGGFRIFNVNEAFLTPRILACALVLLGLEQMIRGRGLWSFSCMIASGLLHPLMAVGGLAILIAWIVWSHLPRPAIWGLGGSIFLSALVVLAVPSFGGTAFGQMDDDWLSQVLIATPYNFPLEWSELDWIQTALTLGIGFTAAVALRNEQPTASKLAAVATLIAAAGLAGTMLASARGYTLLFQGQPYRALWIARLLQPALTLMVAAALWQSGLERRRLAALLLLATLAITTYLPIELAFPLFFLPILALVYRGLQSEPRRPDWLSQSLAGSLLFGFLAWAAYRTWLYLHFSDLLLESMTVCQVGFMLLGGLGPTVWLVLALIVITIVYLAGGLHAKYAIGVASVALAFQLLSFTVTCSEACRPLMDRHHQDFVFVDDFLKSQSATGVRPTVYWSCGQVDNLWLRLGVLSYYERLQIQGVLFSRRTAIEGRRRALLVRQFEVARLKEEKDLICERWQELLSALYQLPIDDAQPQQADLERLSQEPGLDYVIVKEGYPGLYAASNGTIFIYDCKYLRATAAARQQAQADTRIAFSSQSPSPMFNRKNNP